MLRVKVEDPHRGGGTPLAYGVEKNADPAAAAPLVCGEDGLDGVADGDPRKAHLFDDGRREVNLRVTDPLARETETEILRGRGVVGGGLQAAADVAVKGQEAPGIASGRLALADVVERGENRLGRAAGERDERRRRNGALEVDVELGVVGPAKAGEEPAGGVVDGHGTSSYGSGRRAGEPAGAGRLPASRLWIRAAAFGADLLLLAGAPLLMSTFVIVLVLLSTPDPPATLARGFGAAQAIFVLLFLLRDTGGKSPGKRLFGLALHREDGGRVTAMDSLVRNLPMLVPGWNLIELLVVIRRPDGRRQGDRLAGTTLLEG